MNRTASSLAAITLASLLPLAAHAVAAGQIDTFSATLDGWSAGGGPFGALPPTPPQRIAGGGPGGAGDSFMQLTSQGGSGPGSRLTAMNAFGSWSGDYSAAGITAIRMDLKNLGATDLTIRLLFEGPLSGPSQNQAITLQAFTLPAGSGWMHAEFPVTAADLHAQAGSAAGALAGTTVLRLFQGPAAVFPGEQLAGNLGVDNIQAVPEPQQWALMLAGLGLLGALARRRP